jgi:hypothetical protein
LALLARIEARQRSIPSLQCPANAERIAERLIERMRAKRDPSSMPAGGSQAG